MLTKLSQSFQNASAWYHNMKLQIFTSLDFTVQSLSWKCRPSSDKSYADRSIGEKKPRTSGDEGISMKELSGYNSKRQEFEVEYDNDAEQLLADMEFKETDTDAERELKLRVLHIYSKRLDERKRRKDFILERNLLHADPFEKDLTSEEKELCHRYRVFMRFHSREEHDELLRSVVEEQRILRRIQDLQGSSETAYGDLNSPRFFFILFQPKKWVLWGNGIETETETNQSKFVKKMIVALDEARAAGCRTSADAERFIEQKTKREMEENARRVKESSLAGPSGKYLQRVNHQKGEQDTSPRGGNPNLSILVPGAKDFSSTPKGLVSDNWDVTGFVGAEILSDAEKQLCGEIRILPTHYLNMLQTMSNGIFKGNVTKKSDAHSLFNVDPGKVDKVYDMLVKKGIAQT
ncbi:hypothetical protein BUALT_Bualt18G0002300 [Buddleja alternifolia]|uniref:Transcriptional adapter 2-alpha/beta-like domain-containing protein n=1 Tax=Buddleja alternifolia TaxID=168488 RepID=A0AAV6W9E6_9LAMI|nr:hypothetical protein BUALT_Bualt18G0002300 [Buddleja alternifolia]